MIETNRDQIINDLIFQYLECYVLIKITKSTNTKVDIEQTKFHTKCTKWRSSDYKHQHIIFVKPLATFANILGLKLL